jgi:hypothetical protein
MRTTELELLSAQAPKVARLEILRALSAEPRYLTAEEAGCAVEARLRAMTEAELSLLLTIEQRECLRVIVHLHLIGPRIPEESLENADTYLAA